MNGINWGDISSDDSEELRIQKTTESSGLNGCYTGQTRESIQREVQSQITQRSGRFHFDDSDDEDADTYKEGPNSDDDNEVESTENKAKYDEILRNARQVQNKQEEDEEKKQKHLSKKEKQVLKAKELDDLDDLLNEFGVVKERTVESMLADLVEVPSTLTSNQEEDTYNDREITASKVMKKKKKKKKKGDTDTLTKKGGEREKLSPTPQVNVAAVLKAKSKPKEKRATERAAATAVKEANAKKEAASKTVKKKKKTKDKYAHGAPSR